jgi:hypothetical protein
MLGNDRCLNYQKELSVATIKCSRCFTEVPHGATVCTGCQAEIKYGASIAMYLFVLGMAMVMGWFAGNYINVVVGWIIFGALLIGGFIVCTKKFSDSVRFKRIYRTK